MDNIMQNTIGNMGMHMKKKKYFIVSGLQLQRQLWQIEQKGIQNQQFNLCQYYERTDD